MAKVMGNAEAARMVAEKKKNAKLKTSKGKGKLRQISISPAEQGFIGRASFHSGDNGMGYVPDKEYALPHSAAAHKFLTDHIGAPDGDGDE